MSTIGYTYGSEWHLLRYLGHHRDRLNDQIQWAVPNSRVLGWLDWDFERSPQQIDTGPPRHLDREIENLGFLPEAERGPVEKAWRAIWPHTGALPSWDAIGRIADEEDHGESWLIVEAKSHPGELFSVCKAKDEAQGGGRGKIAEAFRRTREQLGMDGSPETWLGPYYQLCNRLTFLNFLSNQGIKARLLFIYFLGDRFPADRSIECPETEEEWRSVLRAMEDHIGWSDGLSLAGRIHKLFLPVCPSENS